MKYASTMSKTTRTPGEARLTDSKSASATEGRLKTAA
jgi:hypothetical protein